LSINSLLSLWNRKVHYRLHKNSPLNPTLSQPNLDHPIDPYLPRSILMLFSRLHLGLPSGLFPSGLPTNQSSAASLRYCCFTILSRFLRSHTEPTGVWFVINYVIFYYYFILRRLACRKRRLKWVATLPLGDINTEAWSSGMGVGRGANNPTL
jgi:hypothetical protein